MFLDVTFLSRILIVSILSKMPQQPNDEYSRLFCPWYIESFTSYQNKNIVLSLSNYLLSVIIDIGRYKIINDDNDYLFNFLFLVINTRYDLVQTRFVCPCIHVGDEIANVQEILRHYTVCPKKKCPLKRRFCLKYENSRI